MKNHCTSAWTGQLQMVSHGGPMDCHLRSWFWAPLNWPWGGSDRWVWWPEQRWWQAAGRSAPQTDSPGKIGSVCPETLSPPEGWATGWACSRKCPQCKHWGYCTNYSHDPSRTSQWYYGSLYRWRVLGKSAQVEKGNSPSCCQWNSHHRSHTAAYSREFLSHRWRSPQRRERGALTSWVPPISCHLGKSSALHKWQW